MDVEYDDWEVHEEEQDDKENQKEQRTRTCKGKKMRSIIEGPGGGPGG